MLRSACALSVGLVLATAANAEPLRIATWNIEHLRAENGIGAVKRDDGDYEALAVLAEELDADIIALQEVDGPEAATRVFDATEYRFVFSDRSHVQRTGFAIRRSVEIVDDSDFVELELDGSVRRGTDLTVRVRGQELRLLSVHLKSGCFEDPLDSSDRDCRKLVMQVPILESWIDARTEEGIPFVVIGDFNRRFDVPGEGMYPDLDDDNPAPLDLVRVNEGLTSECLDGRFPEYIDHIVLDEQAEGFVIADSFGQVMITEADEAQFALSDHCPIFVDLFVSRLEGQTAEERALELFNEIRANVTETQGMLDELNALIPQLRE